MHDEILENTLICSPPLVPELKLRLLNPNGPWKSSGATLFAKGGPKPYWAYAWGSGQALSRYLQDHREWVAGKRVLDFGAGSGIASITAAMCGAATVTASDTDPRALIAISLNADINAVSVSTTDSDVSEIDFSEFDVFLASDAFFHWPGNEARIWRMSEAGVTLVAIPNRRGLARGRELPRQHLTALASFRVRTFPEIELNYISEAFVYSFRTINNDS